MKTSRFLPAALLVTALALGFAGCAQQPTIASTHRASPRSARTFALSVTMSDGTRITPEQWATVKAAFEQQLAAAGYTLVDDVSLAERIIRVVFTPAFDDPANGTATVMSVRDNPMYAYNSRNSATPAFASFGFTGGLGYSSSLYGMGYYDDNYYSYGSSSSVVTPRHEPPNHNRPNNPDNCQPGDNNRHNGGQFANHDGSHRGPTPGSSNGGHWTPNTRLDSGSSGSSFSSPSYSSGSSSYSGPTSSSYSGSSHSLPSASFGGGSSSSSSSSYSSGSSSFSSGSSSDFSSSSSSSSYSSPSVSSSSGSSGGSSEITNRSAN